MTKTMAKTAFKPVEEQLAYLMKGVADVVPEPMQPGQSVVLQSMEPLSVKLERSRAKSVPLRVKLGVDPTTPDIHLGHTVVIRKLKHFQDMGHTAIFLIGDFTALVGDPSGQSETRPPLSRQQVNANARTYLDQVFKILDRDRTEVRHNSEWLDKMTSYDIVKLCGKYRVARMLEREDFRSRLRNNQPISMHELLYPLFQAYDSVKLEADVELGATEQKFNLLMGREIQREYYDLRKGPQVALMMPILVGLDGHRKMSKSLGNYVGITESPDQMFGKLMSIPDDLMWSYYELLTDLPQADINDRRRLCESGIENPVNAKRELAHTVVTQFHGRVAADNALKEFITVFHDRRAPTTMREFRIVRAAPDAFLAYERQGNITSTITHREVSSVELERWTRILATLEQVSSVSEAERLVKGKGLEVNAKTITDPASKLDLTHPGEYVVRVGKKKPYFRIVVE